MKKKYSISFFAAWVVIALMLSFAYRSGYERVLSETKEEQSKVKEEYSMATEGNASKAEIYYLKNLNGFVAVYLSDQKTVYEYTSIPVDNLPDAVAADISNGMTIESEESLYSFLEGYSS